MFKKVTLSISSIDKSINSSWWISSRAILSRKIISNPLRILIKKKKERRGNFKCQCWHIRFMFKKFTSLRNKSIVRETRCKGNWVVNNVRNQLEANIDVWKCSDWKCRERSGRNSYEHTIEYWNFPFHNKLELNILIDKYKDLNETCQVCIIPAWYNHSSRKLIQQRLLLRASGIEIISEWMFFFYLSWQSIDEHA